MAVDSTAAQEAAAMPPDWERVDRTAAACAANQSTKPLTRPSGGARGVGGAARERGLGGAVRGVLPFRRVSGGGRVKPWRVYAVMASVRAIRASLETALAVPGAHLDVQIRCNVSVRCLLPATQKGTTLKVPRVRRQLCDARFTNRRALFLPRTPPVLRVGPSPQQVGLR